MSIKNIADLCYELYKIDWLKRISNQRRIDALKNYYQETDDEMRGWYSFEDYIFEVGFDGESYVCYSEFLMIEYHDKDYIKVLLDNDDLYKEYLKDINSRF